MNARPPIITRASHGSLWFAGVLLAVIGLGCTAVLYFFNPSTNGFYPVCRFHQLTGLNCPGCGATRACHALLHGDLSAALRDNALFVLSLPALLLRGGWLAIARYRGRAAGSWLPVNWAWSLLMIGLVFAVLRNLPAFAFLSPA
jgi:hypothetical protein